MEDVHWTCPRRPCKRMFSKRKDTDECSSGQAACDHYCTNNVGSFTCSCRSGFQLQADGKTCGDVQECADATLCDQICVEEDGSYSCKCEDGFRLQADGRTCTDINECAEDISGCSQTCNNAAGSFTCGCREGFYLDDDEKTCINKDDCEDGLCQNGGTCVDGMSSFSCLCEAGFTGEFCQSDVDECTFINGGCQDICTNTKGSFLCSCEEDRMLQSDRKSCTGGSASADTVFDRRLIQRQFLPRGCAILLLTSCTDGKDIKVYLSSTSNWYRPKSDYNTIFTNGIVFAEINSLSLPVSLSGAEIKQNGDDFSISLNVKGHKVEDSDSLNDKRTKDCLSYDFTPKDIYDFIFHGSFLKTFLSMTNIVLPDWVKFHSTNSSLLQVQDLRTELIYGSKIDEVPWCQGAPVLPDHLYSVFQFDSNFALSVYNDDIVMPKPLSGNKFCLIVDICHNYGGSFFLMVPKDSEAILTEVDMFETLYRQEKLLIKPRGIGLSVVKGINVHYDQKELQLWNGDVTFKYPLFERADLWIGGDVTWRPSSVVAEGSADLYISVPSPDRLLTAMFIDEWNVLVRAQVGFTLTLKFSLFGKEYSISFDDLIAGTTDMYMSVGGTKKRDWCGEVSNPPGIFFSAKIHINPFQNVPILKDWVIENAHTIYVFVTTDLGSELSVEMSNDIFGDLLDINGTINRINKHLSNTLQTFDSSLRNRSKDIINEMQKGVRNFQNSIPAYLNEIPKNGLNGVVSALNECWKLATKIEKHVADVEDITEYYIDMAADNFVSLIKSEVQIVRTNVNDAIIKLSKELHGALEDISGFGLKYTTSLTIFGLKLVGVDIEIVGSKSSLMECSRFQKIKELLKGELALRFLGRLSKEKRLNFFLKVDRGFGVGGAFGVITSNAILQLNAYINIIGIKTTADLFISRSGLYLYLEGNVWGVFLAQVDISAEVGDEWHQLTFSVEGRFVAKAKRKRQTQTDSVSFQASYLDGLTKVIRLMANEADKRISQAQNVLTTAQSGLTKAQNWLEEKQDDVRKAHVVFDNAVAALDRAKDKLEEAKGPFKRAIEKLNRAQRNVDNLCRIRSCRKVCIPGLKCKWCRKGWFGYPCCRFTRCMISFPDPLCVLANLACRAIRAIAFLALEVAKIFVRIPMLALDVAKAVVSVAQFAVDKSRVVLTLAEGALELGNLALEASKGVLELAKLSLEAVKIAIKAAAKVLEFVIKFGLISLIDVRNCGFKFAVSTKDLPVFDVFCDVNAFRLGWKTIRIRINFKNILQTIWQAAKATINALVKGLFGRKRREVLFDASSNMHRLYRYIRQSEEYPTNSTLDFFNGTLDVVSMTDGFNLSVSSDYDNRVMLFEQKCAKMNLTLAFLNKIWETLFDLTNDTKTAVEKASDLSSELESYNITDVVQNMTLENMNISTEYASKDYNLTKDELENTMEDTKSNASNDPLLQDVAAVKELSKTMLRAELKSIEHSALLDNWILLMENETKSFFSETECVEFRDCILYATSEIYDLYIEEDHPNIIEIRQAVTDLEDIFIDIIQNTSQNIIRIYNLSVSISSNLKLLDELNVFCSKPPQFLSALENATVVRGQSVSLQCHAHGNPSPRFWWIKNDEFMADTSGSMLMINNATDNDQAVYKCMAGNVVANLTSNEAFLYLVESSEETGKIVITCYIPTLVLLGVNVVFVAIQVILIEGNCRCMVMNNMWMFLYKVVGPALALCLIAIASQIVIYNVVGLKCNGVDGIIVPILGMLLVEVAAVGTLVVYANGKRKGVISRQVKVEPMTTLSLKSENDGRENDSRDEKVESSSKGKDYPMETYISEF